LEQQTSTELHPLSRSAGRAGPWSAPCAGIEMHCGWSQVIMGVN